MFTGIIETTGRIEARGRSTLTVRAPLRGLKTGQSVAVNGACLTVAPPMHPGRLRFDVSDETWRRTNLGALKPGQAVNLERALKAGAPLGGHLVSGHVDARADVLGTEELPEGFRRLRAALPSDLRPLVAVKGSIAVDGVSLTVTAADGGWFETVLVPHTLSRTTLGELGAGDAVNLEADLIARYVASALDARR